MRLILCITRGNAPNQDGSAYNIGWTFFTAWTFGHLFGRRKDRSKGFRFFIYK